MKQNSSGQACQSKFPIAWHAQHAERSSVCVQRQSRDHSNFKCQSQSSGDKTVSRLDVSEAVVQPSFRSTPWAAERDEVRDRTAARIVFVSESNVCRSVLAEAAMIQLLRDSAVAQDVEISSRGTRDYNLGESPEQAALRAAQSLQIEIPSNFAARKFDFEQDTVYYDMIVVMDKFTAADVMREISVYDTINKHGKYTQKVRRLGEFHPKLKLETGYEGQDIDDPLYGNFGGDSEQEAVEIAADIILESCQGLLRFLLEIKEKNSEKPMVELLKKEILGLQELEWLIPPMLQSGIKQIVQ